jgi:hypothetical protein
VDVARRSRSVPAACDVQASDAVDAVAGVAVAAVPGLIEPKQSIGRHEHALVIPGRASWREPGIQTPDRGYGFRACAKRRIPE